MRGNATGMLIGAAVAAVIVALIMFLAGGVFADIGDDLGPLVLAPFVSIACTIPYAALFVGASFVTMCFVRHGDSRAEVKSGLAAFEDMDD